MYYTLVVLSGVDGVPFLSYFVFRFPRVDRILSSSSTTSIVCHFCDIPLFCFPEWIAHFRVLTRRSFAALVKMFFFSFPEWIPHFRRCFDVACVPLFL